MEGKERREVYLLEGPGLLPPHEEGGGKVGRRWGLRKVMMIVDKGAMPTSAFAGR